MERSKQDYIYECENGTIYGIPKNTKCCLICKHCTDMFYDYTNGPYMFFCGIDEDTDECINCNSFELREDAITVEEYENKINSPEYIEEQKAIKENVDKLLNNKELMEKINKAIWAAPFINAMLRDVNFLKQTFKANKKDSE